MKKIIILIFFLLSLDVRAQQPELLPEFKIRVYHDRYSSTTFYYFGDYQNFPNKVSLEHDDLTPSLDNLLLWADRLYSLNYNTLAKLDLNKVVNYTLMKDDSLMGDKFFVKLKTGQTKAYQLLKKIFFSENNFDAALMYNDLELESALKCIPDTDRVKIDYDIFKSYCNISNGNIDTLILEANFCDGKIIRTLVNNLNFKYGKENLKNEFIKEVKKISLNLNNPDYFMIKLFDIPVHYYSNNTTFIFEELNNHNITFDEANIQIEQSFKRHTFYQSIINN